MNENEKIREAYFEALPEHLEDIARKGMDVRPYVARHTGRLLGVLPAHLGRELAFGLLEAQLSRDASGAGESGAAVPDAKANEVAFSVLVRRALDAIRVIVKHRRGVSDREAGDAAMKVMQEVVPQLELVALALAPK